MNSFEAWAPADVLPVRLTLSPAGAAGSLETLILRAIMSGADTADDLSEILGLAPLLVLGLLGDLWNAERISIQLGEERESITVTSIAREQLAQIQADEALETSSRKTMTVDIAFERLTGRALPAQNARRRPEKAMVNGVWTFPPVIPPMRDDPDPEDLQQADLANALAETLKRRSGGFADRFGDFRVQAAYLQPDLMKAGAGRKYVAIEVTCAEDAVGNLAVEVVDTRLTLEQRERAGKRLQQLIDTEPRSPFVQRLRGRASRDPLRPSSIHQRVADLQRVVGRMATCPAGERQREHDRARDLCAQIASYAHALALTEMVAVLVRTRDEHATCINDMLANAERQVVMAVPWIRVPGLEEIREALLAAVRRGVQVTLLWGISDTDTSQDHKAALGWLDGIERDAREAGHGGHVRYHRDRGSRLHAKVVVADDRRALVTSRNFLSGPGSDNVELGVLLTAIEDPAKDGTVQRACPPIEEVLQFLYDRAPDPSIAFQMSRRRGEFGPRAEPQLHEIVLPRLEGKTLSPTAPPEWATAWAQAWGEAAASVAELVARPHPTVEVITDGAHRGVAREALRAGHEQVLITSDKLTAAALTDEMVDLARRRSAEGIQVALRYGRLADAESMAQLNWTTAQPQATDLLVHHHKMHAKVVVCDDRTVVGSFNHLSVDSGSRRRTGELSVRIQSPGIADAALSALTDAPVRRGSDQEPPMHRAILNSGELGQRLVELLDPEIARPDTDALVQLVAEDPDGALTAVRHLCLDESAEQRVLAAALLSLLHAGLAPSRGDLTERLLRSSWAEGSWAVASALRTQVPDPDAVPRQFMTTALSTAPDQAAEALEALLTDPTVSPTPTELAILCATVGVDLLLGDLDDPKLVEPLRLLSADSRNPASEFTNACLDHWSMHGPLHSPAPQDQTLTEMEPATKEWQELRHAIDSLRDYKSGSTVGDELQAFLFRPGGEMPMLLETISARSDDRLRAWLDDHPKKERDHWIDQLTKAAGLASITDSRRRSFVSKLTAIHRAAVKVAKASPPTRPNQGDRVQHTESGDRVLGAALALRHAATSWPESTDGDVVVRQLDRWLDGDSPGARRGTTRGARSLAHWQFPTIHILRDSHPNHGVDELIRALLTDLCARWTPAGAVLELAAQGQFGLAEDMLGRHAGAGLLDDDSVADLRATVGKVRSTAEDSLLQEVAALRLRCDRAGLTDLCRDWPDSHLIQESAPAAKQHWAGIADEVDLAVQERRQTLEAFDQSILTEAWAEHVHNLIAAGELEAAELALNQPGREPVLPGPAQLARWTWRNHPLVTVAHWFPPDNADTPDQVRESFWPLPGDDAGHRVVLALRDLADDTPGAAGRWVEAVQGLVAETDEAPVLTPDGPGYATDFQLPLDARLPRLLWTGRRVPMTIGQVAEPAELQFSLDMTARQPADGVVVDVADVLSLLGRQRSGATASLASRALNLLATVGSRMPLRHVIAPEDVPAGWDQDSRHRLAWLLAILGLVAEPQDLDALRILGGAHSILLWHLIETAQADPTEGLHRLWTRHDRDAILREAITADVEDTTALLVLYALDRAGACSAEDIPLWIEQVYDGPVAMWIDIPAVTALLVGKGYLIREGDVVRSCGCAAVRALARLDVDVWLAEARKRLHAEPGFSGKALDSMMSHGSKRFKDGPGDLVNVCVLVCDDANRRSGAGGTVDVLTDFQDRSPLWADGALGIQEMLAEFVRNAVAAVHREHVGGAVRVVLRRAVVSEYAEIEITDTGPGFPEDALNAFLAHKEAQRSGGRGKGMYLIQAYAETRGIDVQIGNLPGDGGGRVTITIPIIPPGMGIT